MSTLEYLKHEGEAPEWLTQEGFSTLNGGYLLKEETPRAMYRRVAKACAQYQADPSYWEIRFFDAMWDNWLCPASPVLSNMGTNRGLPISCDSIHPTDNLDSIFSKVHELAMLSKHGAGVGIYLGDIRGRGQAIKGNGVSEGIVPWAKIYDTTTLSVSQGSTRRGASALFLPVEHPDAEEFIQIRRPTGDQQRRCLNSHHGVTITNNWMERLVSGDAHCRSVWGELLKTRFETGEPYLIWVDNANAQNPQCYTDRGLKISTSNLCSEIYLHTDPDHTFVCCLSSLNLVRWDEWKDSDLPNLAVRFLDAVLSEYIEKATGVSGLENALRSAIKGRAIGIGVLGYHSLLQDKLIPFDSFEAYRLNGLIFKTIREKAEEETNRLAVELGEPEWCDGYGRRNTHLMAVAPTTSNSTIAGGFSAGIEPWAANLFSQKSAKGTFIRKNNSLETVLGRLSLNTPEVWSSINEHEGSVQHLDIDSTIKEVFRTAREINQFAIVRQAGQRQKYIDQGQSLNLFFGANSDARYIHEVHLEAWKEGLKSLYYLRAEGVIRGDLASRSSAECVACEA